jgi:NADH:ubiquinone oxidoreductase subunit C
METNSLTPLYASANWYERESWDGFGIKYINHPDLRRILTDYGFKGYPMRKDFPLTGYLEIQYNLKQKMILNKKVNLILGYRYFSASTAWSEVDLGEKDGK